MRLTYLFRVLVLLALLGYYPMAAQGLPSFKPPVSMGSPLKSVILNDAEYGVEEGNPVVYTTLSGNPAQFQVMNLRTGRLLRSFDLHGSGSSWTHLKVSNGDIYIGGNGILYKYNLRDKKLVDLGGIGEEVIYGLSPDQEGNVYFGSYPNAKIGRYNPHTNEFTDFGNVAPNQKYSRTTAYYNGHVFAGIGTENQLARLDLVTREVFTIPLPTDVEPGSSIWQLDVAYNYLVVGVGGGKNTLLLYDLTTNNWTSDRFDNNKGLRLIKDPREPHLVYFLQENKLKRLNLDSKRLTDTGLEYGSFIRNYTWLNLNDPSMPGQSLVLLNREGKASFLNPNSGKTTHKHYPFQGGVIPIQSIENGPNATIHLSGYPGGVGAEFSPSTKEVSSFSLGQAEGMITMGDTIYYGIYPKARIYRKLPGRNVELVYQIPDQDRPFVMKEESGELIIGTIPNYGKLGGSLTILNPLEPENARVFPDLVKNQSIAGLAVRGDTIFGSTTIAGGLGVEPDSDHALIFRFNRKTGTLIDTVQPMEEPVNMISGLHSGPNGNLWAAADGTLLELDPKTLKSLRSLKMFPELKDYGRWRPVQFHWKEGYLYTTLGGRLSVVDPKTLNYNILAETELMTVNTNGDIYYANLDELVLLEKEPGIKNLGVPLLTVAIPGAAYGEGRGGEPRIYAVSGGNPATLNEIDLLTGEVVNSMPLYGASNAWGVTRTPNGKIYVGTYPNAGLYEYDPYLGELTALGKVINGEKFIWRLDSSLDGKVYGGTYPSGKVFEYDPATSKFRDYGPLMEGSQYARSLSVSENDIIYVGMGTERPGLVALDRINGSSTEIKLPKQYNSETLVYDVDVRQHYVFIRITGKKDVLVYDTKKEAFVNIIPNASGLDVSEVAPDGKSVYLSVDNQLNRYDLMEHKLYPTNYKNFGTSRGFGWYKDLNDKLPGWSLVSISNKGLVRVYNIDRDSSTNYAANIVGGPVSIQSLGKGPDGNIYIGGYFSGGLGKYDVHTGDLSQNSQIGQIEGMTTLGNHMYFGIYTGAEIFKYRPDLPFKGKQNPHMIYSLREHDQDRPFAMVPVGKRVAVGTVPEYGRLGGSLSFYEPNKRGNPMKLFKSVVENQSIISLESNNRYLYGGTSVWGGLGSKPLEKDARIFIWDLKKDKKIKDFVPLPGERGIAALALENKRYLWGLSLGTLFLVDLNTEEVIWSKELFKVDWQSMSHFWRGGAMEFSRDGKLMVQARDRIYEVDTSTKEVRLLVAPASLMAIDEEGDIYFARNEHLFKLSLD